MLYIRNTEITYKDPVVVAAILEAKKFVRAVEAEYGLPSMTLQMRHKKTDRPIKKYGKTNLNLIRTPLILHLSRDFRMPDRQIAEVFDHDRTSILHSRWQSLNWLEVNDHFFMKEFTRITGVWKTICKLSAN